MSTFNLINGDFYSELLKLQDFSIDLIFCDLPYNMIAAEWDKEIKLDFLFNQYERILKNTGTVALFACQPFTTYLINANIKNYRYSWYWIKNQSTNFFHAKSMPVRKVEEICIFYKGLYYPQMTTGHQPTNSAIGSYPGNAYYGNKKRNYKGGVTTRFPTNVLNFKCVNNYKRIHVSEKPVDLCEYIIKTYTKVDDTVLDHCCGSGSCGEAAINVKRNFIGIERNEDMFLKSQKRLIKKQDIL
jgi:site-specific DNA-methyltransferase (adenine-specific)